MTDWINRELYPFTSHFLTVDGHRLHYVDEGSGPTILFVHGTPEWSFGWRDLIRELRTDFRCVAPDLLGMGLSDKPVDGDYRLPAHAARLAALIEALDLRDFFIVANDFGVSIALSYAIAHPERVRGISIFNGWMWPVDQDPHYARPARLMRGWLGRLLYLRFNLPVNVIMPAAYGNKRKLTKEVHRHYRRALPNAASRHGALAFAHALLDASDWWADLWAKLDRLRDKPFLIFWGMKDSFVPPYELAKWEAALPQAKVIRLENAGHFAQEEEPERMVEGLRAFMKILQTS